MCHDIARFGVKWYNVAAVVQVVEGCSVSLMGKVSLEEELALLRRGAEDIFPEGEFEKRVAKARETGKPLRIKLGVDPTAADLHLGHVIPILKLKQFQDLGHHVVLIIGDYTATVGDPSGRNKARPQLSHEEVLENAREYKEQVFRILDPERTEVVMNGDWFSKMTFTDVIKLLSNMTLARMLEREDFALRYQSQTPISLHELVYPLMQGYDSVVVRADVELGGTDQKFNILVGRDLQRDQGMEPQVGMCNPVLIGLDGHEKMSKSLNNYIGLSDPPEEMYGKTMSIPDELMWMYFELITDVPLQEVARLRSGIASGTEHPRNVKQRLAREIVARFYPGDAVQKAERHFERVIGQGAAPEEMPEWIVPGEAIKDGKVWIVRLLVMAELASSNGEARRLIEQGGVRIDGVPVGATDFDWPVQDGAVIQVGKRKFVRVRA